MLRFSTQTEARVATENIAASARSGELEGRVVVDPIRTDGGHSLRTRCPCASTRGVRQSSSESTSPAHACVARKGVLLHTRAGALTRVRDAKLLVNRKALPPKPFAG
eukprot:305747-Pleurochrysis_carterae.AAC.3